MEHRQEVVDPQADVHDLEARLVAGVDRDEERLLRMEDVGPYLVRMMNRQEERQDLQTFEREALRQEFDEKMKALAEVQTITGERLNAFILVLERYIEENRQHRNGGNHNNG